MAVCLFQVNKPHILLSKLQPLAWCLAQKKHVRNVELNSKSRCEDRLLRSALLKTEACGRSWFEIEVLRSVLTLLRCGSSGHSGPPWLADSQLSDMSSHSEGREGSVFFLFFYRHYSHPGAPASWSHLNLLPSEGSSFWTTAHCGSRLQHMRQISVNHTSCLSSHPHN